MAAPPPPHPPPPTTTHTHTPHPTPVPTAGELPAGSTMVPVLARLLHFSPQELQRLQSKAAAHSPFFRLPGLS